MKLKKAIVFVLCAVLALPMFACGKAARPGGGGVAGGGKTYTVTFYVGAEAEAASPAGAAQPVSSSADNSADSIFRIVRPLSRSCRFRLPENGPSASGSHSLV